VSHRRLEPEPDVVDPREDPLLVAEIGRLKEEIAMHLEAIEVEGWTSMNGTGREVPSARAWLLWPSREERARLPLRPRPDPGAAA
jgi:hypothetical protein